MPLTAFIAICILGIDFMVYALFEWTYGDKRRAISRKIALLRSQAQPFRARPFVVTFKNRSRSSVARSTAA